MSLREDEAIEARARRVIGAMKEVMAIPLNPSDLLLAVVLPKRQQFGSQCCLTVMPRRIRHQEGRLLDSSRCKFMTHANNPQVYTAKICTKYHEKWRPAISFHPT
jgi:hypothetical protein